MFPLMFLAGQGIVALTHQGRSEKTIGPLCASKPNVSAKASIPPQMPWITTDGASPARPSAKSGCRPAKCCNRNDLACVSQMGKGEKPGKVAENWPQRNGKFVLNFSPNSWGTNNLTQFFRVSRMNGLGQSCELCSANGAQAARMSARCLQSQLVVTADTRGLSQAVRGARSRNASSWYTDSR